ncbi:septum site-determining protein MinC [Geminicoccaceae bacterium 1502E]|nr:septum site-determining protein MinC [Geminicoccaceae bacterium 1502E]
MAAAATPRPPSEVRAYPFQVRGSLQTMLAIRLIAPEDPEFFKLLFEKIAHAPDFFRDAPIVLDVAPVADRSPIDLEAFLEMLRGQRLVPVGLQNGSPAWNAAAQACGLAIFSGGAPASAQTAGRQQQTSPRSAPGRPAPAPEVRRGPSTVITEPVRGGQQLLAPEGDLVVLAPVGHGAEVAAAGHVHIYGALRGRVFAGMNGAEDALIFCDQLNAELLSIAGIYLVNEDIDPSFLNRRVRIRCDGERLLIEPLG